MAAHNLFSGFLLGAPALPAWFLAGSLECQLLVDTVELLFKHSVELEKLILGAVRLISRGSITVTWVCW